MPQLTVSGNEVTDATRAAALAWGTGQQGGQTDGLQADSSFFIGRAATNLFGHGQCESSTSWANVGVGVLRVVDSTVPAPFAPQSIKVTTPGSTTGEGVGPLTATGLAAAVGVFGVGSIYFQGVPGASYKVYMAWVNTDASATFGAPTMFTAGAGAWPTVTVAGETYEVLTPAALAVAAGKIGSQLILEVTTATTRAESFNVAHAMLEKGQTVVAPYVATSGGVTATKPAARVQADAGLLDATQSGVVVWARMGWASATQTVQVQPFAWAADAANNRIQLFWNVVSKRWETRRVTGGVGGAPTFVGDAFNVGDLRALLMRWDAANVALGVNGAAQAVTANGNLPIGLPSLFDIGNGLGGSQIDSDVLCVLTFTGTLTDAEWAAVYALGPDRQPSEYQELLSSALVTAVMPMNTVNYNKMIHLSYPVSPVISPMLVHKQIQKTTFLGLVTSLVVNKHVSTSPNKFQVDIPLFPAGPGYTKRIVKQPISLAFDITPSQAKKILKQAELSLSLIVGSRAVRPRRGLFSVFNEEAPKLYSAAGEKPYINNVF